MSPKEALEYAQENGFSDKIRELIYQDPETAYECAYSVDQEPKEDTRNAACKDSQWAYFYAKNVDKNICEETMQAVKNTKYEKDYEKLINLHFKEQII